MTTQKLELQRPGWIRRLGERIGIEITPADLCGGDREKLEVLYREYPSLAGDVTAIGESDFCGRCQSWCDNPGWWKDLVETS